ncbi:Pentatricopeptide repeat-containing protein [Acorus calamus]|uniref:Pentatricopeptide repeat-containing protein n=1 Tax=Acorus calamus TaxID=4465 RepID=A0AAV9CHZ9_ACOCL|nr:Pentatricopeptide repeat-containing protein [Acorus calamus]
MKVFSKHHLSNSISRIREALPSSYESEILHHCRFGSLFKALELLNLTNPHRIPVRPKVYASLLQTCIKSQSFQTALQIHSTLIKKGLQEDPFVGNSLLSVYFKLCPDFSDTQRLFEHLPHRDVVSWTSMVSGYIGFGRPEESLRTFKRMVESGVDPNAFTLSSSIKACAVLGALKLGRCLHGVVLLRGFASNEVIVSSLIDMYGRNSASNEALQSFEEMAEPDSVSWTSVISMFTRNDRYEEALRCFYLMQEKIGFVADGFIFGSILTACGNLGFLKKGREIHAKVVRAGILGNVFVESSILDMYGKCGCLAHSRNVFDQMTYKNPISWCALLNGYCQNGQFESVLELFRDMEKRNHDQYSFGTIIKACTGLSAVRQGQEVHCQYIRTGGCSKDVVIESALVDLYAKCGLVDLAYRVFVKIPSRNLITWNAMIHGFAQNGKGDEAHELFNEMVYKEGIRPDHISFVGVLFTCNQSGQVERGRSYFRSMREDYKIERGLEHYNCMIGLLAHVGMINEAEELINGSVFRDESSLWAVLLGACNVYSDPEVAERVAKKMMEIEPGYHLSYVLLENVYKRVGQWDEALKLRVLMVQRGIKKMAGRSWIEVMKGGGCNLVRV